MYHWFRRNEFLSGSWPIQVVSVLSYSKNGLQFSPLWMGRKQRAQALVSIMIDRHFINIDCATPRPKVPKGAGAHAAQFERRVRRFRLT